MVILLTGASDSWVVPQIVVVTPPPHTHIHTHTWREAVYVILHPPSVTQSTPALVPYPTHPRKPTVKCLENFLLSVVGLTVRETSDLSIVRSVWFSLITLPHHNWGSPHYPRSAC